MQKISSFWGLFFGLIKKIEDFIANLPAIVILIIIADIIIFALIVVVVSHKKSKHIREKHKILEMVHSELVLSRGLDKMLCSVLDIFRTLVEAPGYFFYLYDKRNDQYVLKAIRHQEEDETDISPSYSGLLSYKKDKYIPQLRISEKQNIQAISIIKYGQTHLLNILLEDIGLVQIVPVKKVNSKIRKRLQYACRVLVPQLKMIDDLDDLQNRVHDHSVSSTAIHSLSVTAHDFVGKCRLLINLTAKMIGAAGGGFIIAEENTNEDFVCETEQDMAVMMRNTAEYNKLSRVLGLEDIQILNKKDRDFYTLPEHLIKHGIELVILVNIPTQKNKGIAAFWYNDIPQGELHRFTGLHLMMKRLADLLDSQNKYKKLAESYLETLKLMAETIDNLEPYTVGYSELMAKYAGIIAREMNLEEGIIKDVVLAAALSNIGVLGFSNELLFKCGKYTEAEYDKMKMHAEVGASIVEATIPNKRVADYIRYHHERIDGYGYPKGIKGEQIPVGSKIIAVVQTFLAKISGRRYREPLPFAEAIDLLKSASGTQLDTEAVDALINWFAKKQARPEIRGRSLGKCWEIRCSPKSVCKNCPAFNNPGTNCWENEGVLCERHGNTCRSCMVYTEFLYRMGPKL